MVSSQLRGALESACLIATGGGGPAEGMTADEFLAEVLQDLENDSDLAEFFNNVAEAAWEDGYDGGYDEGYDSGYDSGLVDSEDEDD